MSSLFHRSGLSPPFARTGIFYCVRFFYLFIFIFLKFVLQNFYLSFKLEKPRCLRLIIVVHLLILSLCTEISTNIRFDIIPLSPFFRRQPQHRSIALDSSLRMTGLRTRQSHKGVLSLQSSSFQCARTVQKMHVHTDVATLLFLSSKQKRTFFCPPMTLLACITLSNMLPFLIWSAQNDSVLSAT